MDITFSRLGFVKFVVSSNRVLPDNGTMRGELAMPFHPRDCRNRSFVFTKQEWSCSLFGQSRNCRRITLNLRVAGLREWICEGHIPRPLCCGVWSISFVNVKWNRNVFL